MTFVTDGKNNIRDYLASESPTPPTHIAFGIDDTDTNDGDSTLIDEVTRISIDTTTKSNKQVTLSATLSSIQGNGFSLKELGLFNAGVSGTMFMRQIFNSIDKDQTIEIKASITLRVL